MDCAKLTTVTVPASVTRMGNDVFDGSGVVSLDLSHVMEFDEFGSIGCCANLKNLSSYFYAIVKCARRMGTKANQSN